MNLSKLNPNGRHWVISVLLAMQVIGFVATATMVYAYFSIPQFAESIDSAMAPGYMYILGTSVIAGVYMAWLMYQNNKLMVNFYIGVTIVVNISMIIIGMLNIPGLIWPIIYIAILYYMKDSMK